MAITPKRDAIEAAGLEYIEPTEIVKDTGPKALNLLAQAVVDIMAKGSVNEAEVRAIIEGMDLAIDADYLEERLAQVPNMLHHGHLADGEADTLTVSSGDWGAHTVDLSNSDMPPGEAGLGTLLMLGVTQYVLCPSGRTHLRNNIGNQWESVWRPVTGYRGLVDRTKHADDLKFQADSGLWGVSPASAASDIGLPTTEVGTLEVRWIAGNTTPNTQQEWRPESGAVWSRYCSLGVWGPWKKGGGDERTPYSEPDHAEREIRVSRMRQRLGRISVGNKGAVALVCDHGTQNFRDILYPMLQERDLTCTLSINPGRDRPTYMHSATDGDVTWAEIAAWADAGIEIANHSMDHTGASGYEGTYEEIVQARIDLEARIGAPVDSWVQPGTFTEGDFDGFGAGGQPEHYWSKLAGRMLLASHAVVTGTLSGDFWPIDGQIPIGAKGYWLDTGSVSGAKAFTEKAALDRTRCLLRLHPAALGDAVSVADMAAVLDDLVAKRDAGRLAVLTLREWAIAQP